MDMLRSHQIENFSHRFYDISGIFDPPSIKDQVIRASILVDNAIKEDIINEEKPLLVIGAGFTGLSAAIKAAKHKVPTYLVEKEYRLLKEFSTITRFVCPNQYDFPLNHWTEKEFPWDGSEYVPVKWEAGSVIRMVQRFGNKFEENSKYIHFIPNVTCKKIAKNKGDETFYLEFSTNNPLLKQKFGMTLSCLGVGPENIGLQPNYSSYNFWKFRGYRNVLDNKDILVCGVGDGGLQDFLLLATNKEFVRDIYLDIEKCISEEIKNKIEFKILQHRDISLRKHKTYSCISKKEKCRVEKETHSSMQILVKELYRNGKAVRLTQTLDNITTEAFRKNHITLAYQCDHFSKCYPLNHFLVLLLAEHKKVTSKGNSFLLDNVRVTKVAGLPGHKCNNNPKECYGKQHTVRFRESNCNRILSEEAYWIRKPSLITVRFGIDNKMTEQKIMNIYGGLPRGRGMEIMPYSISE